MKDRNFNKHARDILLDHIVTAISGNDVPVERSRVYPSDKNSYPRYFVFWDDETIDWSQSTSDGSMRFMQVKVEATRQVPSRDEVERTLQIDLRFLENALERPSIDGALDVMLEQVTLQLHNQGDIPLAVAILTLTVQYRTLPGKSHILV
jgi:hypothetical protein